MSLDAAPPRLATGLLQVRSQPLRVRRKRIRWTDEETRLLVEGMAMFPKSMFPSKRSARWVTIRAWAIERGALERRTAVDYKDRARNMAIAEQPKRKKPCIALQP